MRHKIVLALLSGVLVWTSACTPTPAATPGPYDAACRQAVAAVRALPGRSGDVPEHLRSTERGETTPQPGDFDANTYFTALRHLSMTPGYALDYRYETDFLGGFPLLYARPLDGVDPKLDTKYQEKVRTDGSAEGYLELAVFHVMASQFYLMWHANYNDRQIVCDRAALEELLTELAASDLKLPDDVRDQARALDLSPAVELGDTQVRVSVVTFTKWGGFKRLALTFNREFPHTATSQEDELVPYDCGITF